MAAPQGVNFGGTNEYLARGADLTGNADSKLVTGAFWVRFNSATSGTEEIWSTSTTITTAPRFRVSRFSNEQLVIVGTNSSATSILVVVSSNGVFADTDWHHVCFSFDMSDTAKRHIYIDDVADLTAITYTNDTIDFSPATGPNHWVGASRGTGTPSSFLPGDLADFWLDFGTYVDLSVSSNRRKFVGASAANSVDLGSDGSTPTGSAPIVFLSGATSTWHTNDGTGGGFTENGADRDWETERST